MPHETSPQQRAHEPPPASPDEPLPRPARDTRLLLVVASVVLLSVVVAGVVIFSTGGGTTRTAPAVAEARASGPALVLAPPGGGARHTVVVYEDFGCARCRSFDAASRDFLEADAAAGAARVEYRPSGVAADDWSTRALAAWGSVLEHGSGAKALALHRRLFDHDERALAAVASPDPGFAALARAAAARQGVRQVPTVLLDGRAVRGADVAAIAVTLERALAHG